MSLRFRRLLAISVALLWSTSAFAAAGPKEKTIAIDCSKGDRIGDALADSAESLTIQFQGTCTETVTVSRDNVTIAGAGTQPTLVGGVILDAKRGVTLRDFVVRGGVPDCISASHSSSLVVSNMTVQDCADKGLRLLSQSSATAANSTFEHSRDGVALSDSSLETTGSIVARNNSRMGVFLTQMASLRINSGSLEATNNLEGVFIQLMSSMFVVGAVHANDNRDGGLVILGGSNVAGAVEASRNDYGVDVERFGQLDVVIGTAGTSAVLDNRVDGVSVYASGAVNLDRIDISRNAGNGLVVDEGNLVLRRATVADNGASVSLSFGSKATFTGTNTITTPIQCDGTVLVRGTQHCPAPAAGTVGEPGIRVRHERTLRSDLPM